MENLKDNAWHHLPAEEVIRLLGVTPATGLSATEVSQHRKEFGLKFFRVLVITETALRLMNLKKLVEGFTDKMFWFACLSDITPETLFGRIWLRPKQEGRFALHGD